MEPDCGIGIMLDTIEWTIVASAGGELLTAISARCVWTGAPVDGGSIKEMSWENVVGDLRELAGAGVPPADAKQGIRSKWLSMRSRAWVNDPGLHRSA